MKFSLSAVFLTLLGATSTLAAPASTSSLDKQFGIVSSHSGNIHVHLRTFEVGQSGHVYLSTYDNSDGNPYFNLKNGELFHENKAASIDKDGALVFESSGSPVLNNDYPVACPVPNTNDVYQIYYGKGNGNADCVGIYPLAAFP
ncbi:But2 family protein [Schizosaccharomyces cryophilus OY26]|uniref:But2 family protein n=1 Tax=Schizosaccharomyces cryophilus (strain OY26 / ATCC MYA-4695 / CBS 11777 / NBRC 106824 / NRRL Y48691) TaxID=653667 RepID=S9W2M3_SCHCR|nr:But2 family protein [Schizosaccharomyces cryophilus OY26]EPY52305.1 But2 family protein [Schizosaccharomyces cryophilus OY26]